MLRFPLATALAVVSLLGVGCTHSQGDEQTLVDRAALTVQEMMTQTVSHDPETMLRRAKAVLICPRVFKAGFFAGAEGGSCVLLSRTGNGTWSYPAFYALGTGSFGLQIGIQDAQLMLLVLTDKGLTAVVDNQFKLGANASIAVATLGAGVQGSTTTAVGADIVAFAAARGLFGGIALEGSVMSTRTEWNQAYYGQPFAARQIVMQMQGMNPGADPLRQVLTKYGAPGASVAAARPVDGPSMSNGGPITQSAPNTRGPVQQQTLNPPGG